MTEYKFRIIYLFKQNGACYQSLKAGKKTSHGRTNIVSTELFSSTKSLEQETLIPETSLPTFYLFMQVFVKRRTLALSKWRTLTIHADSGSRKEDWRTSFLSTEKRQFVTLSSVSFPQEVLRSLASKILLILWLHRKGFDMSGLACQVLTFYLLIVKPVASLATSFFSFKEGKNTHYQWKLSSK